jgi:hypothetical protein
MQKGCPLASGEPTSTQPLSPELVLVSSPEDAERARAALPVRPWEQWRALPSSSAVAGPFPVAPLVAPVAPPVPVTRRVVGVGAGPPAQPVLRAPVAAMPAPAAAHRALPRVVARPPSARRPVFTRFLAPAAVVAFVLAAVTWASEQTPAPVTFVDEPAPAVAPARPETSRAVTTSPPFIAPRPAATREAKTRAPKAGAAAAAPRAARSVVRATPDGGYVSRDVRLVVAGNGRSVALLELSRGCAQTVRLRRLPIDRTGAFSFAGSVAGGKIRASIAGRFLDVRRVSVRSVLRGAGCKGRPLADVAKLS